MLNEVAPCKSFMSSLPSSPISFPRIVPVRGPAKHSCKRVFTATGGKREKWSKECSPNHNGCAVIRRRDCASFWNWWSSKHSIDDIEIALDLIKQGAICGLLDHQP